MILKSILLASTLLSVSSKGFAAAHSKDVTMPSANILQDRLSECGLEHFMEKTKIVSQLAGQTKAPLGVAMTVALSYADYHEDLSRRMPKPMARMMMVQMEMSKPMLFEALLKDEPEALDELKRHGLYKPKK